MISFLVKKIGYFFYYFGRLPILNQLGKLLYKLSLFIFVFILKRNKQVEAIYCVTDIDGPNFLVGKSDIDVLVIIREMSIDEEIEFNLSFSQLEEKLLRVFPFLGSFVDHHLYVFMDDFAIYQKVRHQFIERRGKHPNNWKLLYGRECRINFSNNETELDGYFLRFCYDQVLIGIYLGAMGQKYDFRMMYKYSFDIIRMFFIFINKKEALNHNEYKKFLLSHEISEKFLDSFFNLPSKKFNADKDFAILLLYYLMKIVGLLAEVDQTEETNFVDFKIVKDNDFKLRQFEEVDKFINILDKSYLKSAYLNKIPFIESYYLCLIMKDDLSYDDFKEQVSSILDKLNTLKNLKKNINIKVRPTMITNAPDIFPSIFNQKMINYFKFFDCGFYIQSASFNSIAHKLFGDDLSVSVSKKSMRNPGYFLGDEMHIIRIDNELMQDNMSKMKDYYLMVKRLLNEKNELHLTNVLKEYQKVFNDLNFDFNDQKKRYRFTRKYVKNIISNEV